VSGLKDDLKTALLLSAENGNLETTKLLANDFNADLFYCDANGHSAVQLAQLNGHHSLVELLLSAIGKILINRSKISAYFRRSAA